jgi:hypothetical protein
MKKSVFIRQVVGSLILLLGLIPFLFISSCQKDEQLLMENEILKSGEITNGDPVLYWGHQKFSRETGKPNIEKLKIGSKDLINFEAGFVIRLKNGEGKTNLVSSAIVKIDGKQIFGPSDFSKKVQYLSKEISGLTENSVLEVELQSSPGSFINIWIEGKLLPLHARRLKIGRALLEMQAPDVAELLPYYTEDIEYHDPIVDINGIQDMTAFLNQLIIGASPNLVTIVEDETLINDIYSATWIMSGDFLGVPYQARGISIFKFLPNSTQVYYQRDYYSEGDIMATIPGLNEAIGGFRMYYRCSVDPTYECPLTLSLPGAEKSQLISQDQISSDDQLTVARLLVQLSAENWTNVLPFLEKNYEYHDPIVDIYGPDIMAEFLGRLFAGSSDLYTIVEDETLTDDIYMATWTMAGEFNGAPFSAPGMSIVKFVKGTTRSYYSRDYYTEGDVMLGVPELSQAVLGFRDYYRSAVDPTYVHP